MTGQAKDDITFRVETRLTAWGAVRRFVTDIGLFGGLLGEFPGVPHVVVVRDTADGASLTVKAGDSAEEAAGIVRLMQAEADRLTTADFRRTYHF